jgi:hypothetical protein
MKALNCEGEEIIESSKISFFFNIENTIYAIENCLSAIRNKNIELAKDHVEEARCSIFKVCESSFIAVPGLIALVVNELSDVFNYNRFSALQEELYSIYSDFCRLHAPDNLGQNIIDYRTFQLRKIITRLLNVFKSITDSSLKF